MASKAPLAWLPGRGERSWQVVAAVGAPLAMYLVWKWYNNEGIDWFSQPVRETDFDSFLVQQGAHPTGLAPSGAKGKKKGSSKKSKVPASQRGKVSGPFESFLKVEADSEEDEEEDVRNPLDFNSFLKSAAPASRKAPAASATTATPAEQPKSGPTGPTPDQARLLVMYGTEYGFSREIAEKLCARLLAAGKYWPVLEDMAEHPDGYDFSKEQALFIACSTQGDGVPPTEARSFCEWMFAGKAGSLPHIKYAVCALGDKSYTHFCRCGKQLDAALSTAGAVCVAERADVNKEDWDAVNAWMDSVVAGLAGVELIPVGEDAGAAAAADTHTKAAASKRWGKSRPYPATVIALQGLCAVSHTDDKNTIRVELDLGDSGLTYLPGDALGIYPSNAPQAVDDLLEVLGADPQQQVPTPSWQYDTPEGKPASLTLQQALTACYDIKTPKSELFQLLWQALPEAARAKAESAKLLSNGLSNGHAHENGHEQPGDAHVTLLSNGNHQPPVDKGVEAQATALSQILAGGAAAQEAYMSTGRHVIDVLREFTAAQLSLTQVLGCLRQLQPRLYSISSSPLEHPTRVQATIAQVKYQALGADRLGVCSTYVSERIEVGQQVYVYIHKNPDFRLPPSLSTPCIMVGPGTGLAPFRSFILERLMQAGRLPGAQPLAAPGAVLGELVLFFGCRRSDQDYLYGPDLEAWAAAGHITLHTAFSRQQAQKVYVQDRLREQADAVWQLLDQQAGHFYVCGDAANMAGAVEEALLQIIATRLPGLGDDAAAARTAAEEYLGRMSASGRYQRDVWY